ncbi:hypothetical protein L6452_32074 [Arctium lappa]|uniref:Uncharacterized protein n=1 Tax=Arctium lappa TaxID=4217 RepID=A0ACB8Z7U0_ARCLA|nr:hypothetical protein L6452_32074 [Arctium lappa]
MEVGFVEDVVVVVWNHGHRCLSDMLPPQSNPQNPQMIISSPESPYSFPDQIPQFCIQFIFLGLVFFQF